MTKKQKNMQQRLDPISSIAVTPLSANLSPGINSVAYLISLSVALLSFAVYLPTLNNDFVAGWDDGLYILNNVHIRSLNFDFFRWAIFDTKVAMYWHPITWISHAVDYALWGLKPGGHHFTSIVIHAFNSGIAVLLTMALLEAVNNVNNKTGKMTMFDRQSLLAVSGIAGILFGIHPLHVESVAWIAMRKDLLYSFFYMLGIISYLHFARNIKTPDKSQAFYLDRDYLTSLLFFFLALSSKPMAVTLPAVLLILDWYPLKRIESWKNLYPLFIEKLPFLLLSGIISVVALTAQNIGGFVKPLEEVAFSVRILVVLRAIAAYLLDIIAPFNLLPAYPYPQANDVSLAKPEYLAAALIVSVIFFGCIKSAKKQPLWIVTWSFFLVTLVPVIGFFQVALARADRYVYLPSIGLFILMSLGIRELWIRSKALQKNGKLIQSIIASMVIILLVFFATTSVRQIHIWQNSVVLWTYFIDNAPSRFREGFLWRGTAFSQIGQHDKAIEDYTTAISIDPKYGAAYFNRGETYFMRGDQNKAFDDFCMTIALEPGAADAYVNRGNIYTISGRTEQAINDYTTAIKNKPIYPAFMNRAFAYKNSGAIDKAIADLTSALSLDPNDVDNVIKIYLVRGDLYMKTGVIDRAMNDYQKACELGSEAACRKQPFPFAVPQVKQ